MRILKSCRSVRLRGGDIRGGGSSSGGGGDGGGSGGRLPPRGSAVV